MAIRLPESTRPLWMDHVAMPSFPPQTSDVEVDVAIIGGGITGLTAAHLLTSQGTTVALVELHQIGGGETGHSTGHLTEVLDTRFQNLISRFGEESASLAVQANRQAIDFVEKLSSRLNIDCDFKRVPGFLFTETAKDVEFLENESVAAKRLGIIHQLGAERHLPLAAVKAIRFDHQAQFHPSKYLNGLARELQAHCKDHGSYVFENTRMLEIHDGKPCSVTTDRGQILAEKIIVAAHVPSLNRFFLHTKLAAYRTYALALTLREGVLPEGIFWDTEEPYHYLRSEKAHGHEYLIVGGEDHKTGRDDHSELHFKKLEDYARARFDVEEIAYRWSGQIMEPVDGLPFIGANSLSKNVFVATGYSGNGLTLGTAAGILLVDLISERANPWANLFSATRVKPLAGLRTFISENVDYPVCMVEDRLTLTKENDVQNISENEGQIITMGGEKVAAYRDEHGLLHLNSPVCPHLGCHVHWNGAEKSWDCPCHGSRFSPQGELINGPAVEDLKKFNPDPVPRQREVESFSDYFFGPEGRLT